MMAHPGTKPDFMMQTYIRCTQFALWEALRSAEAVVHYDFLAQSAWRSGDTLIFRTPDGTETLHAREVEVHPMTRLVTSFEPKWETGARTSTVVYPIEPEGDY